MRTMNRAYWLTGMAVLALTAPAVGQTWLLELEKNDGTKVLRVADDGGLVVFGDEAGAVPATGSGRRLLWFPGYAAFRAGTAFSNEWDAAYIGYYSTALGGGATADGYASTAFGWYPRAEADYSTAMGHSTTASGSSSTAMGYGTTASGDQSTSMGYHSAAGGFSSTAMGHLTAASGGASTAMGIRATAAGHFSTAMGEETTAQAYASLSLGRYNAVAGSQESWIGTDPVLVVGNGTSDANRSNALTLLKNGDLTIAGGLVAGAVYGSSAPGDLAVAMGQFATAGGDASTAMGGGTSANGTASVAMGSSTTADGTASVAMGSSTTAGGASSVAMGYNTTASGGSSTALGNTTTASGDMSTAMGFNTAARGDYSLATGYNTGIAATASYSTAMGAYAAASGSGAFVFGDASTTSVVYSPTNNSFTVRAAGGAWFYSNSAMTQGARLVAGAGGWSSISDRALKENFTDVDGEALLAGIARLPLQSWNYKAQDASVRHLGPMAQDFYAAFGLGEDERLINGVDIDGVTLAGVQALERRTRDLEAENRTLKVLIDTQGSEIGELRERLSALEAERHARQ